MSALGKNVSTDELMKDVLSKVMEYLSKWIKAKGLFLAYFNPVKIHDSLLERRG